MNWNELKSEKDLADALNLSHSKDVLIFKHSIKCGISKMVLKQFEREFTSDGDTELYYLDLINYRSVSNAISEILSVVHESPQAILIRKGEALYHASHSSIIDSFLEQIKVSS